MLRSDVLVLLATGGALLVGLAFILALSDAREGRRAHGRRLFIILALASTGICVWLAQIPVRHGWLG